MSNKCKPTKGSGGVDLSAYNVQQPPKFKTLATLVISFVFLPH